MDNNQIYIIPIIDKPIKLVIENDILSTKTEVYQLSLMDVLLQELRQNYILRKNLSRQQIHTERGKVKKEYYEQVINFLVKRGISREYINNEVNRKRERLIITKNIKFDTKLLENNKFGIIFI